MIVSLWRWSHLTLALVASLFLVVAAVTGVILSFSPITNELSSFHPDDASKITVSDLVSTLRENYQEIIEVKIEDNEFLQVSVITEKGEFESFYADPRSAKKLGNLEPEPIIFSFSRSLHRSLFLENTGRILMGIVAFLLLLITVTGTALIIKRQLRLKRFFSKVTYEHFFQYWHVILSRGSLIVILIVSITGTYLSLQRFGLLPEKMEASHAIDFDRLKDFPKLPIDEFPLFKKTRLSEVKSIQFPFSPDSEDYFQLTLNDKELIVNQFNGKIISAYPYGLVHQFSQLSFNLHTGKGSILWSMILCFAALSILFLIFSGFKMTLKRRKGKKRNVLKKEECTIVILVGSENGSTLLFARQFYEALLRKGNQVYIDEMNNYGAYSKLEQLIVITSTYGNGEAPSNANKFFDKFRKTPPNQPFQFSVLGFGSRSYPDFCKYAEDVEDLLKSSNLGSCIHPLFTIQNQSQSA
ncbi:MAG: PepSY domain-containing protein, partial [Crocinitomicaceae bacterium]|nr:PepSY domain-containing protein [Crocinitomicaceae bacterium]